MGEYDNVEERLNQALVYFQELETQIGRTFAELGELARARGDGILARDFFSEILIAFEGLGAEPDVARMRTTLKSLQ